MLCVIVQDPTGTGIENPDTMHQVLHFLSLIITAPYQTWLQCAHLCLSRNAINCTTNCSTAHVL